MTEDGEAMHRWREMYEEVARETDFDFSVRRNYTVDVRDPRHDREYTVGLSRLSIGAREAESVSGFGAAECQCGVNKARMEICPHMIAVDRQVVPLLDDDAIGVKGGSATHG